LFHKLIFLLYILVIFPLIKLFLFLFVKEIGHFWSLLREFYLKNLLTSLDFLNLFIIGFTWGFNLHVFSNFTKRYQVKIIHFKYSYLLQNNLWCFGYSLHNFFYTVHRLKKNHQSIFTLKFHFFLSVEIISIFIYFPLKA